jgi:hypothetical protein
MSVLFSFPQVFSPPVKKLGSLIPALYGILVSAHFISCVGLWYFKRWGAELYITAFFAKTLFFVITGQVGPLFYISTVISVIFIGIIIKFYPRMNANL